MKLKRSLFEMDNNIRVDSQHSHAFPVYDVTQIATQ